MTQYSGVYTLQNQGQALTSGQWATEPYFKNTTLLLHADGVAGGAQNNTFLDSSTNAFAITRNGNTTQGTFSPYGPDWSNYFDGSSYLSIANAGTNLSQASFTIETWVYVSSFAAVRNICGASSSDYGSGFEFSIETNANIVFKAKASGSTVLSMTSANNAVVANTWTHVAIVKNSSSFTIYVNGVSVAAATYASTWTDVTTVSIGELLGTPAVYPFLGYISNFRIVKGSAVYTSAFSPSTTPLTAITNTTLLTCQSNRFVDNSASPLTITTGGTPSVQRFSPFPPQYQYTSAVIGGSGYFDGSGDYLSVPRNNAFLPAANTDFTFEAWIYRTANTGVDSDIVSLGEYGADSDWVFYINSSLQVGLYINATTTSYMNTGTTIPLNSWTHVAVSRSGTASNNLKVFVNGVGQSFSTNSTLVGTGNRALTIAADQNGDEATFVGYIADLRLVNGSAVYASNFTPPTAPLTAVTNTQLLCNMTNAGILDNTMMNNFETVGNAQVSTSVVKYGSGSLAFNGSTDWLYNNAGFPNFNTGDFTIEMWVYRNSTARGGLMRSGGSTTNGSTGQWFFYFESSDGRLYWQSRVGVTNAWSVDASSLAVNTWNHIAVVRQNTLWSVYFNGVAQVPASGSFSDSTSYSNAQSSVGGNFSGYNFNGYIDDLRVTNGVARYTSNFVPPKVAFANQ